MRGTTAVTAAFAVLAACGGGASRDTTANRLELRLPSDVVELPYNESVAVQFIVLGAGSDPITISHSNLPHFATMDGSTIRVSPNDIYDAGEYLVTIVAQAGARSTSGQFTIRVLANTAPTIVRWDFSDGGAMLFGPIFHPTVYVLACDAEGDHVDLQIEARPLGESFTGMPTQVAGLQYVASSPSGTEWHPGGGHPTPCQEGTIAVEVEPGREYRLQVRVADYSAKSGWDDYPWTFLAGPCAAGPCAGYGLPLDPCDRGEDCLSGACVPWLGPQKAGQPANGCASCAGGPCPGAGLPFDPCIDGADCASGVCDTSLLIARTGRCSSTGGSPGDACSSRACEDPAWPACRLTGDGFRSCYAQ
jgi:hypothetical protein